MRIIHYIGMDVHTTNYTLCDLSRRINPISGDVEDRMGCPITIAPDYKLVVKFVDKLRSMNPTDDVSFICGYRGRMPWIQSVPPINGLRHRMRHPGTFNNGCFKRF